MYVYIGREIGEERRKEKQGEETRGDREEKSSGGKNCIKDKNQHHIKEK